MIKVKVSVSGNDRMVGAMVKALAFEIGGPASVAGATKDYLEAHGYYTFQFASAELGTRFADAVARYIPGVLASPLSD